MRMGEFQLEIDAPAEIVFGIVGDSARISEWMDEVEETQHLYSPGQPVGTTFRQVIRHRGGRKEYTGIVRTYEAPTHLALELDVDHFTMAISYRIRALQEGCVLTFTCDCITTNPLVKLVFYLFRGSAAGMSLDALKKLKALAEAEAQGAAPAPG